MWDSLEVLKGKVAAFNERYPVGSSVTVIKDRGELFETKIRFQAEVLGEHTAVIWVEGISGAYMLDRIVPWLVAK